METFRMTLLIIFIVLVLIVFIIWGVDLFSDCFYEIQIRKQNNAFKSKKTTPEKTTVDWIKWPDYIYETDTEPRCLEQESLQNLQNTAVDNVTPGVSAQDAADALKDAFADAAKIHPAIYGNWDYAKVCHRCGNCEAGCEENL